MAQREGALALVAAAEAARSAADAIRAVQPAGDPALLPGHVDANRNVKEALGFLKDWVSALITLQTASIGAIGVFLGLKTGGGAGTPPATSLPLIVTSGVAPWLANWTVWLQLLSGALVCLTVASFLVSIYCGLQVLYMLPGSAQRIPRADQDVFSLTTLARRTIGDWAQWHWRAFVAGLVTFGLFIVVRMLTL